MWPVTGRLMSRMAAGGPPPLVSLPPPHRARPSRTQRWWGSSSSSASPPWTTSPSATLPATWGRARRSAHPPPPVPAVRHGCVLVQVPPHPGPKTGQEKRVFLCFLPFIFVSFLAAKKMRKVVENRRWRKLGFGGFRRWFSMLQHTNFSNVWLFFFLAVVHFRLPFLAEGEFFNGQF